MRCLRSETSWYAVDDASNRSPASAPYVVDVPAQNVVARKKKTATASKTSKAGKVKLTLRSRKAFKKGQKVVLKIKSGKTTKVVTAKTR